MAKEIHEIHTNSPEGIKVQINDADVTDIQALLEGPGMLIVDTFSLKLNF